jgi:hypothetical protein
MGESKIEADGRISIRRHPLAGRPRERRRKPNDLTTPMILLPISRVAGAQPATTGD